MHIAQEEISALYECQDCKKTFAGDHAFSDAAIHAVNLRHNITGKATYFIAITTHKNRPDAA